MKRSWQRWLLWGTLICIGALTSMLMWMLFRPLNDIEKQLAGSWRNTTVSGSGVFILNRDRSISTPQTGRTGEFWSIEGGQLRTSDGLADDFAKMFAEIALNIPRRSGSDVTVIDANHFSTYTADNGGTCYFERIEPFAAGVSGSDATIDANNLNE